MAQAANEKLPSKTIVVLAGGESSEREISLASGEAVVRALKSRGHNVISVDPVSADLSRFLWQDVDVAFIALHGWFGEDGQIQQILENAGVAYTGSDSIVSRLASSKSASKERFQQCGVPTPSYVLIHESDDASRIQRCARSLGFPLIVKPDSQGSSLGVSLVTSPEQLPAALTKCFHFDSFGILETAIVGSEWTLGMVDDLILPLIRIDSKDAVFDYEAKYDDEQTQYHLEFDEPEQVVREIESVGRRACVSLGTRGIARVDIRVDNLRRPWVLEVNTVPGWTDHSLVPKAAANVGIDFPSLCELAIQSALTEAPDRRRAEEVRPRDTPVSSIRPPQPS